MILIYLVLHSLTVKLPQSGAQGPWWSTIEHLYDNTPYQLKIGNSHCDHRPSYKTQSLNY